MLTLDHDIGLSAGLVQQIIDAILRHTKPKRIILYGSRARGDHRPTSDVDIAVDGGKAADLFRTVIDDEIRTLLKLEIVDLTDADPRLRKEIEREGITVYEAV